MLNVCGVDLHKIANSPLCQIRHRYSRCCPASLSSVSYYLSLICGREFSILSPLLPFFPSPHTFLTILLHNIFEQHPVQLRQVVVLVKPARCMTALLDADKKGDASHKSHNYLTGSPLTVNRTESHLAARCRLSLPASCFSLCCLW